MTTRRDVLKLAIIAPWLSACGGGGSGNNGWRPEAEKPIPTQVVADDWIVATPESQGVAAAAMQALFADAATTPSLYSLLVVKNGKLIGEQYFAGASASDLRTVASVTKTVSSMLSNSIYSFLLYLSGL